MLQDGEITRAEYNAEIKSREQGESADEDENENATSDTDKTEA
jgi:hypothetical protein